MASECVHPELIGFIAGCLLGSSLTKTGPGGLWYSGRAVNLWSWIWFLFCSLTLKMFSTMNFHYFIGTCHVYTFSSMCDCNSTFSFAQLTLKHFKACWKHSISKRLNPSFGNVKRKWGPQQPWQKLWKKKDCCRFVTSSSPLWTSRPNRAMCLDFIWPPPFPPLPHCCSPSSFYCWSGRRWKSSNVLEVCPVPVRSWAPQLLWCKTERRCRSQPLDFFFSQNLSLLIQVLITALILHLPEGGAGRARDWI